MRHPLAITHLTDDAALGGVTRFLEHLTTSPEIPGEQRIVAVKRGGLYPPRASGDVIVSHLSICWANLPQLIMLRARRPHTPILHVEHSYSQRFVELEVDRPTRFRTLLRIAYSLFDRVVAVSEAQRLWMTRERLASEASLVTIPPTTTLAPFLALKAPEPGGLRFAAIGRLDRQKGLDLLIPAFRRADLPGATLDIRGDGPEREALIALAGGDARIRFHGFSDPVEAMAKADVIAMPSIREPYGLMALEARAAGRLVLVRNIDGLADHVRDGAVAVPDGLDAWAAALRRAPLLQQPQRLDYARRRAAETEQRCDRAWAEMLYAPEARAVPQPS